MSEMTVTPSLTSALMPANSPAPGSAAIADGNPDKASVLADPAANSTSPGTDSANAKGSDVSPFAAIMQRYLAQAVPVAVLPGADSAPLPPNLPLALPISGRAAVPALPVNTALGIADPSPAPMPINIAALPGTDPAPVPLDLAAPPVTSPATAPVANPEAVTVPKNIAVSAAADPAAVTVPINVAALPAADPAPVQLSATLPPPVAAAIVAAPPSRTAQPGADPAIAPEKKAGKPEDSAPDPTVASLAAAPAVIQSLITSTPVQADRSTATEKRPSAAPKVAELVAGAQATQGNLPSGAATSAASAAATTATSDKAAITAALSAPSGEATGSPAKQVEAATPEATFEGILAAAQVPMQAHPSSAQGSTPLRIETPVGTNGWNDKVGEQVVWMVGHQEQRAELVLNPPQLGRVEVTVSIHGDQANAQFVSTNPAVRDALEAALPRLREMMADAGISLGQTYVGSESGNNAANQSANKQENRDNQPRASVGIGALHQMSTSTPWLRKSNGMVDVFA